MTKACNVIQLLTKLVQRRHVLLALIVLVGCTVLLPQAVRAHGGVIMDSGFTAEYEWLVLSANSPVVEGPNLMSFVIYDVETYEPVNGMRVEVLIAHQSSDVPCCNADDHVGPIELDADPENWPGDYSYELPLDGFGNFEIQFTGYEGESDEPAIQIVSPVLVLPNLDNITPEPMSTSPLSTSGPRSPLATPVPPDTPAGSTPKIILPEGTPPTTLTVIMPSATGPNTTGPNTTGPNATAPQPPEQDDSLLGRLRNQWYLWAAIGLIPLALLAFLFLRPSMDELVAQKESELAEKYWADLEQKASEEEEALKQEAVGDAAVGEVAVGEVAEVETVVEDEVEETKGGLAE